jgi:hypothetical protein
MNTQSNAAHHFKKIKFHIAILKKLPPLSLLLEDGNM